MDKVLITGGAGFIGSHLTELFVNKNFQVTIIDNLSSGSQNLHLLKDVKLIKNDILEIDKIADIVDDIDLVVHLAAMNRAPRSIIAPWQSHRINLNATLKLLELAREKNFKFVQASSSSVFGNLSIQPRPEDTHIFKPTHPYGVAKMSSEHYCRLYRELYGLEAIIIRYFSTFGPRQSPNLSYAGVIPIFIKRSLAGKSLKVQGGDQSRNFTFVEDTVKATYLVSTGNNRNFTYNIGGEDKIQIKKLAQRVQQISDKQTDIQYLAERNYEIMESVPSMDNLNDEFGFEHSYSFDKGLEITYQWYKDHPRYFS